MFGPMPSNGKSPEQPFCNDAAKAAAKQQRQVCEDCPDNKLRCSSCPHWCAHTQPAIQGK